MKLTQKRLVNLLRRNGSLTLYVGSGRVRTLTRDNCHVRYIDTPYRCFQSCFLWDGEKRTAAQIVRAMFRYDREIGLQIVEVRVGKRVVYKSAA